MARIQAGSTLVNQYVPPFVVGDSIAQGWELQWNETLNAFEAIDPDANQVVSGFDAINAAIFPNVTQQVFVVPFVPDPTLTNAQKEASFIVTIQGVKQQGGSYTVNDDQASQTTVITLSDTVSNETVEIVGLKTSSGASIQRNIFEGNGVQTAFNLSWLAPSEESLIVTVDGIKQQSNAYRVEATSTFASSTLTFTEPPGFNVVEAAVTAGGTGYAEGDYLTVVEGTLRDPLPGSPLPIEPATLRVTSISGGGGTGPITAVSVAYPGDYAAPPVISVTVTGGTGNDDATFDLTYEGEKIEVIGLVVAGETPASPVQVVNLEGAGYTEAGAPAKQATTTASDDVRAELFKEKRFSGDAQLFDFRDIISLPGSNINLAYSASGDSLYISADAPTFANLGSGDQVIAPVPGTTDPLTFHSLNGGERIAIALAGGELTWNMTYDYAAVDAGGTNPYVQLADQRVLGVTSLAAAFGITLLDPATLTAGDTVTIKNQSANTSTITLTPAGGRFIDGQLTKAFSGAWAYITLYSDGTNYFTIAEG